MRNYTTQMDAARKGIITPEMKAVAKKEYRSEEEIRDLVAKGQVAICANKLHTCLEPNGVGSMLRTKINVNLGVSRDCKDYDIEMQKVMAAVDMGAEAIMDLSSHGIILHTIAVFDMTANALTYSDEQGTGTACRVVNLNLLLIPVVFRNDFRHQQRHFMRCIKFSGLLSGICSKH